MPRDRVIPIGAPATAVNASTGLGKLVIEFVASIAVARQ